MLKSTGCNDCGKCQSYREKHRDFMLNEFKKVIDKLS